MPEYFDVLGSANPSASVMVNGVSAARQGSLFRKEMSVSNGANLVETVVNVTGTNSPDSMSQSGKFTVAQTPETFSIDEDGNLLEDGKWLYTWNCENRLIKMESKSAVPASSRRQIQMDYDYMGRRISKRTYAWNSGLSGFELNKSETFLFDEWNLVAQLSGERMPEQVFLWGTDLGGTIRNAGGVGGLLLIRDSSGSGESYGVVSDANGNVSDLVASGGALAAHYSYGPFGEDLTAEGYYSQVNRLRFSTKYRDSEGGLYYYGFRIYDPSMGRWLNRDPIGEEGGYNLCLFCSNDSVNFFDYFGLAGGQVYGAEGYVTVIDGKEVSVLPARVIAETNPTYAAMPLNIQKLEAVLGYEVKAALYGKSIGDKLSVPIVLPNFTIKMNVGVDVKKREVTGIKASDPMTPRITDLDWEIELPEAITLLTKAKITRLGLKGQVFLASNVSDMAYQYSVDAAINSNSSIPPPQYAVAFKRIKNMTIEHRKHHCYEVTFTLTVIGGTGVKGTLPIPRTKVGLGAEVDFVVGGGSTITKTICVDCTVLGK